MKAPHTSPAPQPARTRRSRPIETEQPGPEHGPLRDYSKTPDAYADLIKGHKLSGALQRDILYLIQIRTWGAYVKTEWVQLSFREIAKFCDREDASNARRALLDLENRGIIAVKERTGCKAASFYKLTPENWKTAPPYEYVKPDPDDDPEADEGDEIEAVGPTHSFGDKLVVRPGKHTATPARLEPAGREAVDFRIRYSNVGTEPLEVSATAEADVLLIRFSQTANKEQKVEYPYYTPKNEVVENTRFSEFERVVLALLLQEVGKALNPSDPADRRFLERIAAAAGPNLPAANFECYARQEIRSMRKRRKEISSGVLIPLAEQAAKLHSALEALPASETAQEAPQIDQIDPAAILKAKAAQIRAASPAYAAIADHVEELAGKVNTFENMLNVDEALNFIEDRLVKIAAEQLTDAHREQMKAETVRWFNKSHLLTEQQKEAWAADLLRHTALEAAGLPRLGWYA